MTTADRYQSHYHRSPPEPLGEPYVKIQNGIPYECRKVLYRGAEYEWCDPLDPSKTSSLVEIFGEPVIRKGDPGYEETIEYLNQFLIRQEDNGAA